VSSLPPSTHAATLAATQFGVISRPQLQAAGIARSTISRWCATGRLQRLHHGLYAFGHGALTRDGWWHAAQLASAPHGAITARAACEIWRLLETGYGPIDVVPSGRMRATGGWLRPHRMPLAADEVTVRRGLRVTTVARAIVDLADRGTAHEVGTALDQALLRGLLDRRELDRAVSRARGRRGLRLLLPAVARLSAQGETILSGTERDVRDALLDAGLPRPSMNTRIQRPGLLSVRPDLLWPEHRLIVEIDGPQHRMPYQREIDRERDAWFTGEGYRVVRFPVEQVDDHLESVIAHLRRELGT